ncbi:MAG: hypothetical protein Q7T54_03415 [Candidatus Levybacteria bacterium]|nr:hypothetical protein [Candidatus Levybacteria bacterium]
MKSIFNRDFFFGTIIGVLLIISVFLVLPLIKTLDNEIISTIIPAGVVMMGWFVARILDVSVHTKKSKRDAKTNFTHEGWTSIQKHLFSYTYNLTEYSSKVISNRIKVSSDELVNTNVFGFESSPKFSGELIDIERKLSMEYWKTVEAYKSYEIFFQKLDKEVDSLEKLYTNFINKHVDLSGKLMFFMQFENNYTNNPAYNTYKTDTLLSIDALETSRMKFYEASDKFRRNLQNYVFGESTGIKV